jgi:hypothetical protein
MFQEYEIYPTGKHELIIFTFILVLTIFVGFLIIFFAEGFDTYRYITGASIIVLGKSYFVYSYYKSVNKIPIVRLNPIGIWLQKKDKLFPWALIEHAVIRKSAIENDQLYHNTLEIKFSNSEQILSYPIDDLSIEPDTLNKILAKYQSTTIN